MNNPLTMRESEILKLYAEGLKTYSIAQKLFICYETVISHKKNIMNKLQANNSQNMIHKAHQMKLLH